MPQSYNKPPETILTPCCTYRNTHIAIKNKTTLLYASNIILAVHNWRCRLVPISDTLLWHLYMAEDDMTAEDLADMINFEGPYQKALEIINSLT